MDDSFGRYQKYQVHSSSVRNGLRNIQIGLFVPRTFLTKISPRHEMCFLNLVELLLRAKFGKGPVHMAEYLMLHRLLLSHLLSGFPLEILPIKQYYFAHNSHTKNEDLGSHLPSKPLTTVDGGRNPVNSPVQLGSCNPTIYKLLAPYQVVTVAGNSEPSTGNPASGAFHHPSSPLFTKTLFHLQRAGTWRVFILRRWERKNS